MAQGSETFGINPVRPCFLILCVTVLLAGCSRSPKHCAVCERDQCKGLAFRVTLQNGKTVETCCPRCGLHYLASTKQQAKALQATDLASGQWIDATKAVYVEGSDVSHCAPLEVRRDAQGCCLYKTYDRCLPSLIAFQDAQQVVAFQKQHGGEVLSWERVQANPPPK
jgi:nitrous oxide reductase accessory protein NosL